MKYAGLVPFLALPALVMAGAALATTAYADESMRCGRRLVSKGATSYEVIQTCGEPQAKQHRSEWRRIRQLARVPCSPNSSATCIRPVDNVVEVQVEEWVYDPGPYRLIRIVTFEQGRLQRVETGGRGTRKQQ